MMSDWDKVKEIIKNAGFSHMGEIRMETVELTPGER